MTRGEEQRTSSTHKVLLGGSVCLVLLAYLLLANTLRFWRVNQEKSRFARRYPDPASLSRMTNEDAHYVIRYLQQYEFPFAFEAALAASLYRPYGIPSISRVLARTKQFSTVSLGAKRTADTAVLVIDFAQSPPESERCCGAISRMNYVHGVYQKAGIVKDEDLLYTLALLAWLPIRFIERFEWRQLTDFETHAAGVFWKSLGDAMNLSYRGLPSAPPDDGLTPRSAGTWANGVQFLIELRDWADQYEQDNMKPDPYNHRAAMQTQPILVYGIPKVFQGFARHVLSAAMDEKLRRALILPDPSRFIEILVFHGLQVRKWLMRYVYLPRFRPHMRVTESPDANGRRHRTTWATEPWYVKPTLSNRWRWQAWKEWLAGRPIPGDCGLKSGGFLVEEVGPQRFEGKGLKEFADEKQRLMRMGRGGCPFSSGKY